MKKYLGALEKKSFKNQNATRKSPVDDAERTEELISPFIRDANAIEDSKAFRRLKDKAQVFVLPNHSHVRTRMTHTMEVNKVAKIIARFLGLNVDLCSAIAKGHDIGHTPFGHQGEAYICEVSGLPFTHAFFSAVVAQLIERNHKGLNLCLQTIGGIASHSRKMDDLSTRDNIPLEYSVVMLADKIAYTMSDYNDARRYGYLPERSPLFTDFGASQRERLARCINALIQESAEKGTISFVDSEVAQKFKELRKWMNQNVYQEASNPLLKEILALIYRFFKEESNFSGCDPIILLALLTDKEANELAQLFIKSRKPKFSDIGHFGIMEIYESLRGHNIKWYRSPKQ